MSTAIFNDAIFSSSELNRRSGYVLDTALEKLVTITRNNDSFALVKREFVANMAMGIEQISQANQIINVVFRLTIGQEIESTNEYKWVTEFNQEERIELLNEINEALNLAKSTNDWEEVVAVIHEWRESAIAIASDELDEAFA